MIAKTILLVLGVLISSVLFSQSINCKILKSFLLDERINDLVRIDSNNSHDIIILDSCKAFSECSEMQILSKNIVVIQKMDEFNLNPAYRADILEWKNRVLFYKVETKKKSREFFFFYKPTNALGSVVYRIKKGRIKDIEYRLGQL